MAKERDLRWIRYMDPEWLDGSGPLLGNVIYNPYGPGSVVASILWAFTAWADVHIVAQAVMNAQRVLAPQIRDEFVFEYGELESLVITELPATAQANACDHLAAALGNGLQAPFERARARFEAACP